MTRVAGQKCGMKGRFGVEGQREGGEVALSLNFSLEVALLVASGHSKCIVLTVPSVVASLVLLLGQQGPI
jgi:hypothetical protein